MTTREQLRLLEASDVDAYRRLRLEALQNEPKAFSSSFETEIGLRLSHYRERFTHSAENYVSGAWIDAELIGIVGFVRETAPNREHVGSVWGTYVSPRHRARGVGRRLLADLIERSRRLPGLERLRVTVLSDNAQARRFYESLGFAAWGTETAALKVDGVDYGEIHLGLDLRTSG
jgi:ribosomal protein S18 acetylase RimI-like enzyme